jgi:hypothetical protein
MDLTTTPNRRRLVPASPLRLFRLERGVPLVTVAVEVDTPPSRLSQLERDPTRARPGEIERLQKAIEAISRRRLVSGDAA